MEYLKFYSDRLRQCEEIINDAIATGDPDEVEAAYSMIGKMFMASMRYGLEKELPDFKPRSIEGAEWRGWRSDVDRCDAKLASMRELGSKGGKAKAAKIEQTAHEEKNEIVATPEDAVATPENDIPDSSPKVKVKVQAQVNAQVKDNVNVKVKDNAREPGDATADHRRQSESAGELSVDEALKQLCDDFPDVRRTGFKIELRKDLEEYGYQKVRYFLEEADNANEKQTLQCNFYRAVKRSRLDGTYAPPKGREPYNCESYIRHTPEEIEASSRAAVVDVESMEVLAG